MKNQIYSFVILLLVNITNAAEVDTLAQNFEILAPYGGLQLEKGSFDFATAEDCPTVGSCAGNNPTSPYGIPKFRYAGNPVTPDSSGYWQLRRDQAVVLLVQTPPEMAYFGFTHYVYDRYYLNKLKRSKVFASLGDTTNNLTIRHNSPGQSPFEKLTAVVITASLESYYKIAGSLSASGISPENINLIVLPYDKITMGLTAYSDTFQILTRIAKPVSQVAFDNYVETPPVYAYKTSASNSTFTALPAPLIRQKGTGSNENYLVNTLNALENAVKQKHSNLTADPLVVTVTPSNPENCLKNGTNCNGDNRDALYESVYLGQMPPTNSEFVIVYGVNHTATGKATYTNFSNYDLSRLAGVSSVIDDEYAESGKFYLGENFPDADKVYAYKVARQCLGEPFCIEIPFEGELSIPADKPIGIVFRSYLEEATKTGPLASELLRPRALRYR